MSESEHKDICSEVDSRKQISRREFLKIAGIAGAGLTLAGGLGGLVAACGEEEATTTTTAAGETTTSVAVGGHPLNAVFGPGGEAAGQGLTINVGMLVAVTGVGSFYGDVMPKGAKLAAKHIEAAGGPKFNIIIGDHQSGATQAAVSEFKRMAGEGIQVLETSYGTPTEAITGLIEQYKVISFNGGGASPGQLAKPYLWMTRMLYGDDPITGAMQYMYETFPDVKKVAVYGMEENAVAARVDYVPHFWPIICPGGEIVSNEPYDLGLADWGPLVGKMMASKPDMFITMAAAKDQGASIKAIREQNFTGPILGIEITEDAQTVAGKWYDGIFGCMDAYDVNYPNPLNKEFVAEYRAEYNAEPEFFAANYYEITTVVWDLVRQVIAGGGDPTKGEALNAMLEKTLKAKTLFGSDPSVTGEMGFDAAQHTTDKPMAVFQMQKGERVTVAEIKKVALPDGDPKTGLVKIVNPAVSPMPES